MESEEAFGEFVKAQGKIGNVGKNRNVDKNKAGYGYRYADLGELLCTVKPALKQHNFAVVWELAEMNGRFIIACKVLWKAGT
jgi:hypothetical protein